MGLTGKQVVDDHLNRLRNWLKHWHKDDDPELFLDDLQAGAILYIARALTNLEQAGGPETPNWSRFGTWAARTRPDLFQD